MAASENLSSARVAPRSVMRVTATSARISSIYFAHKREVFERDGQQHAVALEDLALVGEVDRWDLEILAGDVLPHVQLGPVGDGEGPDVLALADAPVEQRPQLGALVLGVPLAEVVAEGEHPLLGPGLLLVPA